MHKRLFKAFQSPPSPAAIAPLPDGFYIISDDCVDLGCCEAEVSSCIRMTPNNKTEMFKQPDTEAEIGQMLVACGNCAVNAIRYNGTDSQIHKALGEISSAQLGVTQALPPIDNGPWRLKFFKR